MARPRTATIAIPCHADELGGEPVLDAGALEQLEGISARARLDGVLDDLIELFLEECEEAVTSLVTAYDGGRGEVIAEAARSLRLAALRVGARPLAAACARVEDAAACSEERPQRRELGPLVLTTTGMAHEVCRAFIELLRQRRAR